MDEKTAIDAIRARIPAGLGARWTTQITSDGSWRVGYNDDDQHPYHLITVATVPKESAGGGRELAEWFAGSRDDMNALLAVIDQLHRPDGPWLAVLADRHGDIYPTFTEAAEVLPDDAEMMIRIVRGTALPVADEFGDGLRVATEYNVGDLAYETDAYLTDPDDLSQGAKVLYARAQAMAEGLNAAELREPASVQVPE